MRVISISRSITPLLLLIALSFTCAASAHNKTGEDSDLSGVTLKLSDQTQKESQTEILLSWIKQLQPILKNFGQSPGLHIRTDTGFDDASSDSIELTFNSGETAEHVNPTFAHEYGHTVFNQPANFARVLPSCLYPKEEGIELQRLFLQVTEIRDKLYQTPEEYIKYALGSCTENPRMQNQDYRALCTKFESLGKRLQELSSVVSPYNNQLFAISKPYDEFFADLLSVLVAKNGQAMSTATHDPKRVFTSAGRPKSEDAALDPHGYFLKTRQLLWSKFESQGKSLNAAQNLLQITYEAIGAELARRLQLPNGKEMSVEQIETGLLIEIEKRLK